LESLAYQSRDVIDAMKEDSHLELKSIRVNGGATTNDFLMQFQADIMNIDVERPEVIEATALGVAYLAGLKVGYWEDVEEIYEDFKLERLFSPEMNESTRSVKYEYWKKAVERTMDWVK
ncbi:MAG: glycerol kinase, partial [Tissierellia bacterium]|nr:glycerol kinase [Tissierellia bacterium]